MEAYVDVEWADEFLLGMGEEEWRGIELARRRGLLVQASVAIDLMDNIGGGFLGKRTGEGQFWAFPRNGGTEVPMGIKMACALEALALADEETAARRRARRNGVSGVRVGDAQEQYLRFGLFGQGMQRARTDVSEMMASVEAFGLVAGFLRARGVFEINAVKP